MKALSMILFVLASALSSVSAGEEAADFKERQRIVALMEGRIVARDQRVVELANEIRSVHHRLNAKLNRLVDKLSKIEDSPDSGFRLGKAKLEVIDGLKKATEEFVAQREALEKGLRAGSELRSVEDVHAEIDHLNAEADNHLAQMVKLSLSFARDENVSKYERVGGSGYYTGGYGWFGEPVEVSDEWRQNRRNRTMDQKQRKEVSGVLDRAIERCEENIQRAESALENGNPSSEEKEILQAEIDVHRSMLKTRQAQKDDLLFESQPETTEVGRDLARELEKAVEDELGKVQEDIRKVVLGHRQLREEQAKIAEMESLLADRKAWLEEHRPEVDE
jgi:hypothetical protein